MDKRILIGGGVAAAALVVFIVVKKRGAANQDDESAPPEMMPDSGYFSALAPSSGGVTSGSGSGGSGSGSVGSAAPSDEPFSLYMGSNTNGSPTSGNYPSDVSNSGSTNTGGGFSFESMMAGMFETQAEVNKYGIMKNAHNFDAAILASIIGNNGTATVNHTETGTTLTNKPGGDGFDMIFNDLYKKELGRAPDTAGLVYWKNEVMNNNLSLGQAANLIRNSNEAKGVSSSFVPMVAAPNPINSNQSGFKTVESVKTTINDGIARTILSKKQA